MSGFEFASAVVGLIDLGAKVVVLCSTYFRGVVDAQKNANQLLTEVSSLQICLGELGVFASTVEKGSLSEGRLWRLKAPLIDCQVRLSTALKQLDKSGNGKNGMNGVRRMVWPFMEKELRDIVSTLSQFRATIADTITVEIGHTTRGIAATLARQDRSDLLQFLSPLEPEKRHQDVRSRRLDGTVSWLLESEWFKNWRRIDSNAGPTVLCCIGNPGVGKTVVTSVVIDDLLQDLENAFVVFIYCDYRDQALQTSAHLLGSLLAQVVKRSAKLPDGLKSAYEVNRHSSSSFDTQQATQFLTAICKQLKRTYCCIDALDELGNDARVQLLQSLQLVCHECPGFRIFFTGRPSIEAKVVQFLGQSTSIYQARIKAGDEDVKRFIIDKLDGEPDELLMNDSLKMSIVKTLVNLSNGMFLLPAMHIEAILNEQTIRKRRLKLTELPRDLFGTFEATLRRIRAQHGGRSELAMDALMWVSLAQRPLKVDELRYALAIVPGETGLNAEEDLPPPRTLLENTLGLLAIDEETQTVRLVHYSLQEYFRANQHDLFPDGHTRIALSTLTYLSFDATVNDYCEGGEYFPFVSYAAENWGHHARQQSCIRVVESARHFLLSEECFIRLKNVRRTITEGAYFIPGLWVQHSVLHEAAYFGAEMITSDLLALLPDSADLKDEDGRTPLSWAAEEGHEGVVRLLLERDDVDVNSKDERVRTPLSWAAAEGQEGVVRLLLEREDVEADSKDVVGDTPLSDAAARGREGVVRQLLERKDVNLDSSSPYGRTPLSRALAHSHEVVVRMLLAKNNTTPFAD